MRIYDSCYELMSEMGRDLWEMGQEVRPNSYQNKDISGNEDYVTKELMMKSYCLTSLDKSEYLFKYTDCRDWADAEFEERLYEENNPKWATINPGEAWKLREETWKQFLNEKGKFDYTYNERLMWPVESHAGDTYDIPTMLRVLIELKENPGTRQAIIPIFHSSDLDYMGGKKRIPCSMYYMFMVREVMGRRVLHMTYHQRSSDFVTHFGNDCYLAWKMKDAMAAATGYAPGYLYHIIDSLHVYAKDWSKIKGSING